MTKTATRQPVPSSQRASRIPPGELDRLRPARRAHSQRARHDRLPSRHGCRAAGGSPARGGRSPASACRRGCAAAGSGLSRISSTRPGRGDITTMRSARNTASGIEWVMNSTVLRAGAPDALQLEVHLLARHRVERAERLVHEEERRVVDEGAGDRGALLHAAGQLVRIGVLEPLEAHEHEQFPRSLAARTGRAASTSTGSVTFSSMVRHGRSTGLWNTMPTSAARLRDRACHRRRGGRWSARAAR